MSSTDFPEPPEEFLKYPAGNLIALMTDGDALGDEHEELLRAADHLQAGGLAVRVPADKDEKAEAARILGEHGAVHIVYMSKATYETLGP